MIPIHESLVEFDEYIYQHTPNRVSVAQFQPQSIVLPISRIKNQRSTGACTGFAATAALETNILIRYKKYDNLSDQFAYQNAKRNDVWIGEKYSGTSVNAAVQQLSVAGICHQDLLPFIEKETIPLTTNQYEDAQNRIASDVIPLAKDLSTWKQYLISNMPIVFGVRMFSGLEEPQRGYVTKKGISKKGGHAMMCYGYKDFENVTYILVKNSWGVRYGINGCCFIPFSLLQDVLSACYAVKGINDNYEFGSKEQTKYKKVYYKPWHYFITRKMAYKWEKI